MPDREAVDFLAAVPLFDGSARADLGELAGAMRRRRVREGELLWRQGDDARDMAFIVSGRLSASLRVAGGRGVEVRRAGPRGMVGETALVDGGGHTTTVRATEDASLLVFGRRDFAALLSRQHPSSFVVKRRLAHLFAARLRATFRHLAGDGDRPPPEGGAEPFTPALEYCDPPDSRYLRRMATFHEFDRLAVWGFLTSGRYARCAPGSELLREGAHPGACYLLVNGAVEKVMTRGDRRIRVGLAGPGKTFGYEGLIDGRPSPVTAVARERALLLELPRGPFAQLFGAEDAISRVVLDVILRDIVATLRQTLSPLALTTDLREVG